MEGQQPNPTARNVFDDKVEDIKQELEPEPEPEPKPEPNPERYRWYNHVSPHICDDCGCLVADTTVHDQWHAMVES